MGPTDIVISIILLLVLGGATAYVIRAKKAVPNASAVRTQSSAVVNAAVP